MGHETHNEWSELKAAMRSEAEMERVMRDGADRATAQQMETIRRHALRAMAVGLPDPRDVARHLETADPDAAEILRKAWKGQKQPYAGHWRVEHSPHTAVLRSMGLVEAGGGFGVGNFGNEVRKALLGESD